MEELLKLFVASFNSSIVNDRQAGRPCIPKFAASEIKPEDKVKMKTINFKQYILEFNRQTQKSFLD